jgi:PKD repeat protein
MNIRATILITLIIFSSTCITLSLDKSHASNGFPVALFTYEVNGFNVTFNATSSYDTDGTITNFIWDFGDNSIAYGISSAHNYISEGIYYVYLVVFDEEGKTNFTYQPIVIDMSPPFTLSNLVPLKINGNEGWYISGVTLKLEGYDSLSEYVETYYKIGFDEWEKYSSPIKLDESGYYTIKYYSVDSYQNEESEKIITLNIDNQRPYTNFYASKQPGDKGWYKDFLYIALEAYDNFSGIDNLYYRIDGDNYKPYLEDIVISEGYHIIEYFSTDKAGNAELLRSQNVNVDSTSPNLTVHPFGGLFLFGKKLVSDGSTIIIGNLSVEAHCDDNLSGIEKIEFYFDGEHIINLTSSPYKWHWNEFSFESHELKVIAYDNAGNINEFKTDLFIINFKIFN